MNAYDLKAKAVSLRHAIYDNDPWGFPSSPILEAALLEAFEAGQTDILKSIIWDEQKEHQRHALEDEAERQRMDDLSEKAKEPQLRKVEGE